MLKHIVFHPLKTRMRVLALSTGILSHLLISLSAWFCNTLKGYTSDKARLFSNLWVTKRATLSELSQLTVYRVRKTVGIIHSGYLSHHPWSLYLCALGVLCGESSNPEQRKTRQVDGNDVIFLAQNAVQFLLACVGNSGFNHVTWAKCCFYCVTDAVRLNARKHNDMLSLTDKPSTTPSPLRS